MTLKTTKLRDAISFALVVGATTLAGSGVALAQDAGQEGSEATTLDRIEVTGSRIRSVDAETSQPVLVLSREDIQKQGVTSVAEVLNRISAAGPSINRTWNNGGDGSSTISLRNLGSDRTLVLVDGRRWVSGLGGSVDLNTIPSSIIERVEVLKDGASSIYGSDAIAGVINIITRDNYEGAEIRTHLGQYNQGDGERNTIEATIGMNGERGNVIMSLSRVEEGEVVAVDREISRDPIYGLGASRYSGFSDNGKIWNTLPPVFSDDPDLNNPTGFGGLMVVPPGSTGIGPDGQQRYGIDQFVPYSSAAHGYNYAKDNYLLTPQTRTSMYLKGRYDITDSVSLRADALYNERRSSQQLAGFPLSGGPNLSEGAMLSGDSYFNPFNTVYGGDGRDVEWSHRLTEQARTYEQNVKTFHTYVGLEGSFQFADRYFDWDAGYSFNKSNQNDEQVGDANMLAVNAGVGPSTIRDGQVVCTTMIQDPAFPSDPTRQIHGPTIEGCVPFNPLAPAGGVTPEMLNAILFTAHDNFQSRSESFTANVSGEVVELPAGMMGFAVGVESRKESGYDHPDAFVSAGYSSGNARKPTDGSYDLDEIYGELLIPILADMPGAQLLEVSLASRYSDYSNFGDTTNSKFGFKWKPIGDLLVRGNWAEGFRAPSINTLFGGLSDSYESFGDICSADFDGRNATIAANCAAAGVSPSFLQRTNDGVGFGGQTVFPFQYGSNPNAGAETSVSKTLGLVYSPSFASGLDISVDWWNIKIDQALSTPTADYVVQQCYAEGIQEYCDLIQRRPSDSQIGKMLLGPQNLAIIEAEGYDLDVNYRTPESAYGQFNIGLNASYMAKWDKQATAESPVEHKVGLYEDRDPQWRLRANGSLDWSMGDFGVTWISRYYSGLVEDCAFTGATAQQLCSDPDRRIATGAAPRNKLGATTYHDVQARYELPWNGTVKLGVNNVFKKVAPTAYKAFANSFDPSYDVPNSQYIYMEYVQRF